MHHEIYRSFVVFDLWTFKCLIFNIYTVII